MPIQTLIDTQDGKPNGTHPQSVDLTLSPPSA
jgi:hypothetical protein